MKIESSNQNATASDRSMMQHKYSFDATLKRSIPVVEAEAQVRKDEKLTLASFQYQETQSKRDFDSAGGDQ
jgi:hypothetical protein